MGDRAEGDRRGESTDIDLKLGFDPEDNRAWLELIKDVAGFANSGGGVIRFGQSETDTPGIPPDIAAKLDSSDIAARTNARVMPGEVEVEHSITTAGSRVIVDLRVLPVGRYPVVFSRDGNYRDSMGRTRSVFNKGDIYVRRGTTTRKATREDLVRFIDEAVGAERGRIEQLFQRVVQLPPGVEPIFRLPTGEVSAGARSLLDSLVARREQDRAAMLSANELLLCFVERRRFDRTPDDLDLLIRGALRRTPTLYFWLTELDSPSNASSTLLTSLSDRDRDISDSASNLLEVGALVLNDGDLESLLNGLARSRFKHHREAAKGWSDRSQTLEAFNHRVVNATTRAGALASDLSNEALWEEGDFIAGELLGAERQSPSLSKKMSDLGRVLFSRRLHAVGS